MKDNHLAGASKNVTQPNSNSRVKNTSSRWLYIFKNKASQYWTVTSKAHNTGYRTQQGHHCISICSLYTVCSCKPIRIQPQLCTCSISQGGVEGLSLSYRARDLVSWSTKKMTSGEFSMNRCMFSIGMGWFTVMNRSTNPKSSRGKRIDTTIHLIMQLSFRCKKWIIVNVYFYWSEYLVCVGLRAAVWGQIRTVFSHSSRFVIIFNGDLGFPHVASTQISK